MRKTIVDNETIGGQFDEFYNRERFSKSDISHLAVVDLLIKDE